MGLKRFMGKAVRLCSTVLDIFRPSFAESVPDVSGLHVPSEAGAHGAREKNNTAVKTGHRAVLMNDFNLGHE